MKDSKEKELDKYYQTCAFPKPKTSKKKLLENGYKDKPNRMCWYTGTPFAERHEIFPGIFRQMSIEMGFQVDVCSKIHQELQADSTPWAKCENQKWRMYYQWTYEQKLIETGIKPEEARTLWISLAGRSFL